MITENVDSWTDQWKLEGKQEGLDEGIPAGTRRTLARLTYRRFGEGAAEQSKPLLESITDADRLEELTDEFLLCPDADAWLTALRAAAGQ